MNVNIGDVVVLSNKLKMKLILEDNPNYFKTVDIENGSNCTTGINIKNLSDFCIGNTVFGHGVNDYEIVDIIKNVYPKPPLGVMPKKFYELQRAQDICRALYEYINYEKSNYDTLIEWCKELSVRLYVLKSENT